MPQPIEPRRAAVDRLDWYLKAKFGLFVHWGAYAVAGVESSWPIMSPDLAGMLFGNPTRISEADYTALPQRFNPQAFDARAWVRLAQETGMRYIVFTAKHHDGFCMFDAPGTDYKVTNTPFGRDICLELADACAQAGMRLGFYYSPPDMRHPGYRDRPGGPDRDQPDIALEIVGNQPGRHVGGRGGAEEVHLDLAFALRVAEHVAAGEDQGLALA